MTDQTPIVRGRDFKEYRIGGAIAALLLLVALTWQIIAIFDGQSLTVPETQWRLSQPDGNYARERLAYDALTARTRLMDERFRTGPAPSEEAPVPGPRTDHFLTEEPFVGDPQSLTQTWLTADARSLETARQSERVVGISSLPYPNAALFERPEGRDWRFGMADTITHLGAVIILGFSLLLALVLAVRGRVPIAYGRSRRTVKRFNFLERANHWMTSTSFIVLALTGLVIAYGDTLIRPFGEGVLGSLGRISTWGHALFFPPFAVGLLIMILLWTWRNLPSRLDLHWLASGGGFFSDDPDNPPARKFNAGQKLVFWAAVLGGIAMIASGVMLMFPFFGVDLEIIGWIMLGHATLATVLIAIFIGHIYIGTVGMQGAIWAMWDGEVDRNWAEEHHELWLKDLEARGDPARDG
ncbi:formate dehydrogenase subunit gamma [Roseovarius sp. B08]|uniref:formate dehydrogenase subunit gamma n=1 Tax=Roseovarius sp. B08 TaxID=3449223 RepID=UPI003EDB743B